MIVTIDGPAGAGKSSVARELARRLGCEVLDTGAMYRAVALAALRAGQPIDDDAAMGRLLTSLRLDMPPGRVVLGEEDVTSAIRTAEVSAAASVVAARATVRRHLVALQRQVALGRDLVAEGRDQGTIVFPDAACKFFLIADPAERARRRRDELAIRGEQLELAEVLRLQEERDRRDAARDLGPMQPAADAVVLDTTVLTQEQVVDCMEATVRRRVGRT